IMDVQAGQTLYGKVFEQFGEEMPQGREEIEAMFTEFTKLRLHEDFLSLLGGEYMQITDFADVLDLDEEHALGDICLVVHLLDARAAAQNLDKALRARGMHAARKTEDYGDTKIYSLRLFGMVPVEYAFAEDVFVLGLGGGEGTRKNLRSVLDTVAARSKGAAATELSAAVQTRLQGWPEDWAAIDVGDLSEVLDGVITSFDTAFAMVAEGELEEDGLEWVQRLADFARKLRPELLRHDAAVTLNTTYLARDACVVRSRW
ncbi:MAG TPA: hypothetical protein VFT55_05070, partial [Planctomycetota bacterium]|nr:hypothetical protein [Planctomycetota bacterium]